MTLSQKTCQACSGDIIAFDAATAQKYISQLKNWKISDDIKWISKEFKFKIWFMEGGCGTFVPTFLNMVASLRKNNNKGHDEKFLNNIASGNFSKTAYVDPNDPSVIFLEQPDVIY